MLCRRSRPVCTVAARPSSSRHAAQAKAADPSLSRITSRPRPQRWLRSIRGTTVRSPATGISAEASNCGPQNRLHRAIRRLWQRVSKSVATPPSVKGHTKSRIAAQGPNRHGARTHERRALEHYQVRQRYCARHHDAWRANSTPTRSTYSVRACRNLHAPRVAEQASAMAGTRNDNRASR